MKTQDITCPDCGAILWANKTVASMSELRRNQDQLVERHKQKGECKGSPMLGEQRP